jgi:hypothetical protein
LKIEPKLRRQTEVLPQANGGVATDGPVSPDNVTDARKIEGLRQFISTQSHWLHELGLEKFAGWTANTFLDLAMVGALPKCASEMR